MLSDQEFASYVSDNEPDWAQVHKDMIEINEEYATLSNIRDILSSVLEGKLGTEKYDEIIAKVKELYEKSTDEVELTAENILIAIENDLVDQNVIEDIDETLWKIQLREMKKSHQEY